jgi:hypothetical protein
MRTRIEGHQRMQIAVSPEMGKADRGGIRRSDDMPNAQSAAVDGEVPNGLQLVKRP